MPPNPYAVQTVIKCPKTGFNTWLKSFAPGFSARFSYEEEPREHALDFFQHCLSEYSCMQTETRGQQPKKASLPQQTVGVATNRSHQVGWSYLHLSGGLSLHHCWRLLCPCWTHFPIPLWATLAVVLRQYFRKKADLEIPNRKLLLLKRPIFRMEALFNTNQCTDLHQLSAKKGVYITAGERSNNWNGRGGGKPCKLAPEEASLILWFCHASG